MSNCLICGNNISNHSIEKIILCDQILTNANNQIKNKYNLICSEQINPIKNINPMKMYECKKCKKQIKNKQNYDLHIKNKICEKLPIEFKCQKCNKIFQEKRSLIYHNEHRVCEKNNPENNIQEEQIDIKLSNQIKKYLLEQMTIYIKNNLPLELKPQFKKKKISPDLKRNVWKRWIGSSIGQTKCVCCNITDIEQLNFCCGHVIPYSQGGLQDVNNLRPICFSCATSIGKSNMFDFMRANGFKIKRSIRSAEI